MVRVSKRNAEAAEKAATEKSAAEVKKPAPAKKETKPRATAKKAADKAPVKKAAAATKKTTTTTTTTKKTTTVKKTATKAAAKTAPSKAAAKEAPTPKKAATKRTRDETSEEPAAEAPVKKARTIAQPKPKAAPKPKIEKPVKPLPVLTEVPKEPMAVMMFGTGDNGELGLGPLSNAKEVKRPRLNPFLDLEKVGVVHVSLGGMHGLALTKEGKVYSWGVNDMCALGRDTKADVKVRDIADNSDSEDEVAEVMNKLESTPMEVKGFPEGTIITRIAAGDSISIAVTNTGKVYAWGTFRAADGVLGFSEDTRIQETPVELPGLKNIVEAVCGTDHVLVLDNKGVVYAWGNGQQNQLGRRVIERTRINGLVPRPVNIPGRKKVKAIFSGHYHSFALDVEGTVWVWGLNSYGQTGIYDDNGTDTLLTIPKPMKVEKLSKYKVKQIASGQCHTVVVTEEGELLCWGRMDAHQAGINRPKVGDADIVKDVAGKDRILVNPTKISEHKFVAADCGTEHSVAVAEDGTAWSWGFGELYQVGQGPPARDIEEPTKIENTKTKEYFLKMGACGGNFSCLAGIPREQTNGN